MRRKLIRTMAINQRRRISNTIFVLFFFFHLLLSQRPYSFTTIYGVGHNLVLNLHMDLPPSHLFFIHISYLCIDLHYIYLLSIYLYFYFSGHLRCIPLYWLSSKIFISFSGVLRIMY